MMEAQMFYKNKKVLVTGGTGFLGVNLILELLNRGAKVRATIHKKTPILKDKRIQYMKCELTKKQDCLAAVKNMDFVFHCAASTSGALMIRDYPLTHITENILLNSLMLEASFFAKVKRFLFVSSSIVYPPLDHPMREEEAFQGDPYDLYFGVGWMKRYVEKLSEFYHRRYQMNIALIRPTNVFGPYDKFDLKTSHVLPALIRRAVERQNPYEVWGDGSAVRDFIYVADMVQAMLLALEKAADCKAVNFATGRLVSIKESVELILRYTGHTDAKLAFDPSKPTTIPKRLLDLTGAQEILGYEAKVSFEEGLKKTIDWYLSTKKSK